MTKSYFISILLLVSFVAEGQIKKKSILLGGELFYSNDMNQVDKLNQRSSGGTISISAGKAFKENKVAGFNFSYLPVRQTNFLYGADTTNLTYNRFDIGVFYRQYKKLAKDLYFFSQVDGAFITADQTEKYRIAAGNVNARQRGGYIALTPGISYQVFKKMQLEITLPNMLGVQYLVTKTDSHIPQVKDSKQERFLFYSNFSNNTGLGFLGVGFRFIL